MEKLDWASVSDVIEHPVAWDLDVFYMLGGDNVESIPGAWVTPGFVRGLGIQPAIGRGFELDAFAPGSVRGARPGSQQRPGVRSTRPRGGAGASRSTRGDRSKPTRPGCDAALRRSAWSDRR